MAPTHRRQRTRRALLARCRTTAGQPPHHRTRPYNLLPPRSLTQPTTQVAIVTGGDSGIGRSVALLLAKESAKAVAIVHLPKEQPVSSTVQCMSQGSALSVGSTWRSARGRVRPATAPRLLSGRCQRLHRASAQGAAGGWHGRACRRWCRRCRRRRRRCCCCCWHRGRPPRAAVAPSAASDAVTRAAACPPSPLAGRRRSQEAHRSRGG